MPFLSLLINLIIIDIITITLQHQILVSRLLNLRCFLKWQLDCSFFIYSILSTDAFMITHFCCHVFKILSYCLWDRLKVIKLAYVMNPHRGLLASLSLCVRVRNLQCCLLLQDWISFTRTKASMWSCVSKLNYY